MRYEIEQINNYPKTRTGHAKPDCEQCGFLLKLPYYIIWKINGKLKSISTICCKECLGRIKNEKTNR